MRPPLLSYDEAAAQVHRFVLALASGTVIPASPGHPPTPAAPLRPRNPEVVALESACGRVLAAPILADRDQPAFPRSTRDGFACRAAEVNTGGWLFLAGLLRAGQLPERPLALGEILEIMTGATLPDGADCVVMLEHVEQGEGFVRQIPSRTITPGDNFVPRGAECRIGDTLVPAGVRLTPAQIAVAAQCGYRELAVHPRPRVAILSSGDELVPHHLTPGPGQIRNSNTPMLAAMVAAAGAMPVTMAIAQDSPDALESAIRAALDPAARIDLLLITGGISVGKFDLVAPALTHCGARFFFGGVAIQPGKPVAFGSLTRPAQPGSAPGPLPFFALPGNPISSAVTFQLFALPLVTALAEDTAIQPRFARARLAGHWKGKSGLMRFLPAWCDFQPQPTVQLIPWQGSGDLAAFAASNCYLVVPADRDALEEGKSVTILLR